ncbi:hypothetical protein ACVXHB_31135 [Escherichia coli]
MVVGVINTDGTMTQEDFDLPGGAISRCAISRTSGVGDVPVVRFTVRDAYLDEPDELNKFQLTPVDVITAIKAQTPGCGGSARWYAAGERPTA